MNEDTRVALRTTFPDAEVESVNSLSLNNPSSDNDSARSDSPSLYALAATPPETEQGEVMRPQAWHRQTTRQSMEREQSPPPSLVRPSSTSTDPPPTIIHPSAHARSNSRRDQTRIQRETQGQTKKPSKWKPKKAWSRPAIPKHFEWLLAGDTVLDFHLDG